jgi:hypothetical protein
MIEPVKVIAPMATPSAISTVRRADDADVSPIPKACGE